MKLDPETHTDLDKASKHYKRFLRGKKRQYEKTLNVSLRSLKTDDPKAYWKKLNASEKRIALVISFVV